MVTLFVVSVVAVVVVSFSFLFGEQLATCIESSLYGTNDVGVHIKT